MKTICVRMLIVLAICTVVPACDSKSTTPPASTPTGGSNTSGNAQGGQQIKSLGQQ